MTSSIKGFSKLELIVLLLILCTITFIAIPVFNSYRLSQSTNQIKEDGNQLKIWNQGVESNTTGVPAQILH